MLQRILVGVDGSPGSRAAAKWAASLALQTNAGVFLLFVSETPGPLHDLRRKSAVLKMKERDELISVLDELSRELGPRVERLFAEGDPEKCILEAAESQEVDLIVLGARGLGAGTRVLLGSVSDAVVHHAKRPVVVVKAPEGDESEEEP